MTWDINSRVMDSKWGGRTESVDVKLNTEQVKTIISICYYSIAGFIISG